MQLKNYLSFCIIGVLILLSQAAKAQTYGPVNAWFDTDSFIWNNYSGSTETGPVFLLPDSGAYWIDSKGVRQPINTFAAGHVFDVAHELWAAVPSPTGQSMFPVGLNCPFTWDSLQFQYFYERHHPDTSVVDTLFIYYYHNFADAMLKVDTSIIDGDSFLVAVPQPATLNGQKHFRVDTVLLAQPHLAAIDSQKLYKIAVDVSFSPSPSASVPNFDRLLGFNIVYKPGHKINIGDTVFIHKDSIKPKANIFGAYFYRIPPPGQGQGNYVPLYMLGRYYPQNSIWLGNYGKELLITSNATGFISSWDFYASRFFSSAVHITSTSCPLSVNQPTNNKGIYFKSISPNPVMAGNDVVVDVNTSTATQLKVQLRDVFGSLLFETEPQIVDGEDFFKINIVQEKGVYFVLLIDCQNNIVHATSRLIVAK